MQLTSCDQNNADCMLQRCDDCPGEFPWREYLSQVVLNESDESSHISFKEWTTTDREEMLNKILLLEKFIDLLIQRIEKLTPHLFIARGQANYLNQPKQDLPSEEVIVLKDFAENYQFILQDEIQGFHWNSSHCTLHPIVIYCKVNKSIQSHSRCCISNDLTYDVDMVYEVIKHTINFAKTFEINKINYFSDGCAGQYRNCKIYRIRLTISKTLVSRQHGHFLLPATESLPVMELVVLSRD